MKFYTVCTLPNYHAYHVTRLYEQLNRCYSGEIELYCYTDNPQDLPTHINAIPIDPSTRCQRQWNKIDFFGPMIQSADPVIVMDLDWTFTSDITDIINASLTPNQFMAVDRWWVKTSKVTINGGMYKFYPGTCSFLYDVFYLDPTYWQQKYIREGTADPPVNGEQNFVQEHARRILDVVMFPGAVIGRYSTEQHMIDLYNVKYKERFGLEPYLTDGTIHPNVRMIHSII